MSGLDHTWLLTRRQQFIHIGGKNSEKEEDVKHGVPRIIPLLFLICISDPHALPEVAIKPILENICYFFPGAHREVCWFAEHIPILQEGWTDANFAAEHFFLATEQIYTYFPGSFFEYHRTNRQFPGRYPLRTNISAKGRWLFVHFAFVYLVSLLVILHFCKSNVISQSSTRALTLVLLILCIFRFFKYYIWSKAATETFCWNICSKGGTFLEIAYLFDDIRNKLPGKSVSVR